MTRHLFFHVRRGRAPGRLSVCPAEGDDYRRAGHPVHLRPEFPEASGRRVPGRSGRPSRPTRRATSSSITAATRRACSSSTRTAPSSRKSARAITASSSRTRSASTRTTTSGRSDEGTNMVTKFSPEGKVLMVLGRRPPAVDGPGRHTADRTRRRRSTSSAARPTSAGIRRATSSSPTATATTAS